MVDCHRQRVIFSCSMFLIDAKGARKRGGKSLPPRQKSFIPCNVLIMHSRLVHSFPNLKQKWFETPTSSVKPHVQILFQDPFTFFCPLHFLPITFTHQKRR